jgi:hypothetical protein
MRCKREDAVQLTVPVFKFFDGLGSFGAVNALNHLCEVGPCCIARYKPRHQWFNEHSRFH